MIHVLTCLRWWWNFMIGNHLERCIRKLISRHCLDKTRTRLTWIILRPLSALSLNVATSGSVICFIDLRKAFDTVIHAGIRYKLIKYGISWKLYSIIKDMYRKSELCVRINNKITPTFKSFVGVKTRWGKFI
jgi:hypothetical protein